MTDRTQYWRDYYQKNKDVIQTKRRIYNEARRQKHSERSKIWRDRNRDAIKVANGLGISIIEARQLLGTIE